MGILKMKWNEAEMRCELEPMLDPGEQLLAGVYCTYQDYGFLFTSKRVIAGYLGLTDRNRLVGTRYGIFLHEVYSIRLDRAALHLTDMPLGAVHLRVSDPDARFGRQRITFGMRGDDKRFPSHAEYAAMIRQAVQKYAR
ncbi:MAG: hypothetical protein IKG82_12470 [Oscillospiraceae bacterium]|nr:hypothetical protein [Oscillospiraceae bacterium]